MIEHECESGHDDHESEAEARECDRRADAKAELAKIRETLAKTRPAR